MKDNLIISKIERVTFKATTYETFRFNEPGINNNIPIEHRRANSIEIENRGNTLYRIFYEIDGLAYTDEFTADYFEEISMGDLIKNLALKHSQ